MSDTIEIPINPPKGLLMSMALRYDHALGFPGYYDQPFLKKEGLTHEMKLNNVLNLMRKLHEEVVGRGFYKPELERKYKSMINE